MPRRPIQTVHRDASLAPATVTAVATRPRRSSRQARGNHTVLPAPVTSIVVHPLVWAEVRRRTGHLVGCRIEVVSATEVVIY